VSPKALTALKERLREITSSTGGRSLTEVIGELRRYLVGWQAYFRLANTPAVFAEIDRLGGKDFLPEGRPAQPPMPQPRKIFEE